MLTNLARREMVEHVVGHGFTILAPRHGADRAME